MTFNLKIEIYIIIVLDLSTVLRCINVAPFVVHKEAFLPSLAMFFLSILFLAS